MVNSQKQEFEPLIIRILTLGPPLLVKLARGSVGWRVGLCRAERQGSSPLLPDNFCQNLSPRCGVAQLFYLLVLRTDQSLWRWAEQEEKASHLFVTKKKTCDFDSNIIGIWDF